MNVYPLIEAERQRGHTSESGGGNVTRACALLKVSRSAYYAPMPRPTPPAAQLVSALTPS